MLEQFLPMITQETLEDSQPCLQHSCQNKAVATDTVMSDTAAVDDGSTMAQFFCNIGA